MKPPPQPPRIADPDQAADHLTRLLDPRDSAEFSALVVLCDVDSRPLAHVRVVDCANDPSPSDCAVVLDNVLDVTSPTDDAQRRVAGVALAVTRPGDATIATRDRTWFRAFHRVCHARGLRPFGVYVATAHGIRHVQIDDAA